MPSIRVALVVIAILTLGADLARAHSSSTSYLHLAQTANDVEVRIDIALRDLNSAVRIDLDQNGEITWGEVKRSAVQSVAYIQQRVTISLGSGDCASATPTTSVARRGGAVFFVAIYSLRCPSSGPLNVSYRALFDQDADHRALLSAESDVGSWSTVFSPYEPTWIAPGAGTSSVFLTFWREGVTHILMGFDHLLFLAVLLLPCVLVRSPAGWVVVNDAGVVARDVFALVTAFTLAHSITLVAGTLGWISIAGPWVEPVIALSVALAALNNIVVITHRRRYAFAFALGLLHGLGFAGALSELVEGASSPVVALLGFNLGVEAGQLALTLIFVPLLFVLRRARAYRLWLLQGGSSAAALIAMGWMIERL